MKNKIYFLLAFALMLCSAGFGAKKVHTLGDSTMAPYEESQTATRGWGMYFGNFLTNGWTSVNYAKGGRDSRGGYNELWQNAKNNVQAGDYVLIQFAHNDEKLGGADREAVYNYYISKGMTTEAAALDTRGTTPSTTYKQWLTKIVDEVKAKGAVPVLVSAVCRCYFSNEKITRAGRHDLGDKFTILTDNGLVEGNKVGPDDHTMDYSYHMQQLATELGVEFIDMTTATKELYESYGSTKCKATLFNEGDNTHYNTTGALLAARLCAQLMKEQGILSDNILVPTDLSVNPAAADLGDGYKGQTAVKELTLNGFGLTPAEGTISIKSTDGIELSLDKKVWTSSLSVDYKNGTLVQTFFARVQLADTGLFTGTITATLGDKSVDVPLTVNVIELGGGEPFSVTWPLTANDDAVSVPDGFTVGGSVTYSMLTKYGNNADYGTLAYVDGGWTKAEDDDPSRYVQFSVRCPEGQTLDINNITMFVGARGGNGMRCHVYYSTDGFRNRTTIYAPTSMTSNTMNSVEAQPVVSLEEGEELLLRVYPWYTSDATGKYICIKDVTVSGQVKNAGGVNIEGSIRFKLDKGGTDQADEALFTPDEMKAGFAAMKFTAGSALTMNGTTTYTGQNNEKTVQTAIYNGTGASFAGAATADNTLTLTLTPEDGYQFVPTKVSFEGARYGTDGGTLTVSAEAGSNQQVLCEKANVNRSGKNLDLMQFSYELSNLVASFDEPMKLNFSFIGLGNTKTMGLSNIVIEGQLVGSSSTTTKYTLNTIVEPAEAGTVTREPDLAAYKEDAEVTLTATKNFGYRFVEWQDGEGQQLSQEASYIVTMNEEKTVKAVFQRVPVYTVTTRVTNDADRTLGSITLTPNDHNNQYEAGTEITAKANESKILKFLQWTDPFTTASSGMDMQSATRVLTVNSDMELVANYEVQDFIAVFDASANNYYAYPSTSGYPFPADLTWDNERSASSAVVKVADGSLAYTKDGGTPVVRNREGVVLAGINGLYQNGYNTTDIAWQFQFSTKGFTTATFTADMAAKNIASKQWKALISTDGKEFSPIDGATWTMTANVIMPLAIELPASVMGQESVCLRITGDGDEKLSSSYAFDKSFDGLQYCDHSESGVGNVYVLGTAEVVADDVAPVVTATLPANGATGVSATSRITISYDERIQPATVPDGAGPALIAANGEKADIATTWSSRSVSFSYMGLSYGTEYTFTLPAGFVEDRSGNAAKGLTLTFTTMERQQPQPRLYDAVVDAGGNGSYGSYGSYESSSSSSSSLSSSSSEIPVFSTVQAAIDAAPTGRTKPWLIFIKNGQYKEHVDIPKTKPYIHLIGQNRDKTVILDNRLCGGDNAVHVSVGATVVVNADNCFFENLTMENSYGHEQLNGPQALALNTMGDRIAMNGVALLSYQDTWITTSTSNNRHYIKNSVIEGAVDFIYNSGNVYLDGDTLEINRPSGGYIVAPSHAQDVKWGYVFQNNVIRPRRGIDVKDVWLGRPWHNQPKTVFINTQTFVNIPAKGWYNTMGGLPALWAEYNTTDANGNPVDLSQRESYYYYTDSNTGQKHEVFGVKNTLTAEEAARYTVKNVMSGNDNWQPDLMCEACDAPVVKGENGKLTWGAVPYAICYVVTKNGEVAGFTTGTSFDDYTETDTWQVQAVNEYGGLSKMATANIDSGIGKVHAAENRCEAVYTLDGRRVNSLQRGLNIVRLSDGQTVKIMR
jgi:pectin methylesterase-like acyl-CoA thioesterase/lysophospholipase L1-like esterase